MNTVTSLIVAAFGFRTVEILLRAFDHRLSLLVLVVAAVSALVWLNAGRHSHRPSRPKLRRYKATHAMEPEPDAVQTGGAVAVQDTREAVPA